MAPSSEWVGHMEITAAYRGCGQRGLQGRLEGLLPNHLGAMPSASQHCSAVTQPRPTHPSAPVPVPAAPKARFPLCTRLCCFPLTCSSLHVKIRIETSPKTLFGAHVAVVMQSKVVATINSTGRQAASLIRAASAIGWHVRAQVRSGEGLVAEELSDLPNVELIEGDLTGPSRTQILNRLFSGAKIAFINTTHWGNEVAIGKACADAAKRAGIGHYIFSSMPDHSTYGQDWRALPMWETKFAIENYVRQIGIPATFVYTAIYNNNFTSLPYPLFQMELQDDGSFVWQAPFHPDDPLPWLDAEHDVGPALLQIFKMGPSHWKGQRVALAFEKLTPIQACHRFSRGVGRPVRYIHAPIKISVSIPSGYREHLEILQETLGEKRAPYFGPDLEYPQEGRSIWEGYRGLEEYSREVFPIEEYANGFRWMEEDGKSVTGRSTPNYENGDPIDEEGARPLPMTPAGMMKPAHISGAYAPRSHPEGVHAGFFVGSC